MSEYASESSLDGIFAMAVRVGYLSPEFPEDILYQNVVRLRTYTETGIKTKEIRSLEKDGKPKKDVEKQSGR